jgi:3-hydroxyacyl-CoA dehydrogenase/3a,7a,12a-trihydroxy-5b-cholest-24-enoyl-CoA hydratase
MADELRFDGRVALVTGAGNGLGRSHALLLASRGAKVVVNDLGGSTHGEGKSSAAADKVVAEIKAAGGQAVANYDSVESGDKIVQCALDSFGSLDIVINNAGILRDVSFAKMTDADWDLINRVHVLGSFRVTHAAWPHLRDKGYGRVVMTASAAGIYGNFGQANYSTAKLGLVGFAQTLALEGAKRNIHVNAIAPIAGSRMTETVLPAELVAALKPEFVSPLVAWLCHERCEENGGLFEVGGGYVGKLRWERAEGQRFKLSQTLTPEKVQSKWQVITDFSKSTHPTDVTSAMQPVIENLQSAKSRGGNEFIDVDEALAAKIPETTSSYNERDLALYALGVGAAHDPLDPSELKYVYELHSDGFRALPTYAVIPALNQMFDAAKEGRTVPGLNFGLDRILHGEQFTEVKRPLPPHAKLTHRTRIKDIFDKGKNALVVTATTSYDENGNELLYNEITTLVRGAGGFGGERGPSSEVNLPPDRAPDAVITEKTSENQALLYRLAGDWNPLHADPDFAQAFGFKRPILHGLCTFGYAGRAVIKSFSKNDPRYFKNIKVRFADSVFPGETLRTEMWKESDTRVIFRCKVVERDSVVISNAAIELYKEIPSEPVAKAKPAAEVAPANAPAASPNADGITSGIIFTAIGKHIAQNAELVNKVSTLYHFKLSQPDSSWTINLKSGAGSVSSGAEGKADCTLALTDADFIAMCTGKADAQKLFTSGKLKITGNVMASQKLEFLRKMDPALVLEAMGKSGGSSSATSAPASSNAPVSNASASASANAKPKAPEVFEALRATLAKSNLVSDVNAVLQFHVREPESHWVVDLKNGAGSVREGKEPNATTTIELTDEDLRALSSGETTPKELYQHGNLRVLGEVRPAHQLGFLRIKN